MCGVDGYIWWGIGWLVGVMGVSEWFLDAGGS
jgi:hypothetical protein